MDNERKLAIGQYLFIEGTHYYDLREKVYKRYNHLSVFLHDTCASIHFREGFEILKDFISKPTDFIKHFLKDIKLDLHDFAADIINDPLLGEVKDIYGLCTLSSKWGERHGFKTYQFIDDPEIVRMHDQSIIGIPKFDELSLFQPLTIFHHTRESFVQEFGRKY